jgi:hypothetical protein
LLCRVEDSIRRASPLATVPLRDGNFLPIQMLMSFPKVKRQAT